MRQTAQILKDKGLKVTPQRIAIYNMLAHSTEHPNAETIYKTLEEENPTMSLGTVYKTLDYFKQYGLVQELNVGTSSSRYDAIATSHPHTVCTTCGKVDDLFTDALDEICEKIAATVNFKLAFEQLILYGTCAECCAKASLEESV